MRTCKSANVRETLEIFTESILVCELKCPRYWTLKTVLLTMEQHFSAHDSLALALFKGPHMLSHMLLESTTLRDVRQLMNDQKMGSGWV